MDYLLDLLQGLGIAASVGIRPYLPTLLVGALATQNLGLDFENTDFSFLEGPVFLLVMLALVVLTGFLERRRIVQPTTTILLVSALILGALLASGSIADHSEDWWPGVPIGVAAASSGKPIRSVSVSPMAMPRTTLASWYSLMIPAGE